jgi:AcrR family transcriptional regulator
VTRELIADAARTLFAEQGYDRASVRAVATLAGVDPRLVTHHFGTKQELFVAAVGLPVAPETITAHLAGDPDQLGERLARLMISLLSDEAVRQRMVGLIRSATAEPAAAQLLRETVGRQLLGPLAAALPLADAPVRVALVGAQLIGLVVVRYVVGIDAAAQADPEDLVRLLAPVLQHYLGGSVPSDP